MRSLTNTLRTRGLFSTISRGARMVRRYGIGEKKIRNALAKMSEDSRNLKIGITIPITGNILNNESSEFLKTIQHDGFEYAIHGFSHFDFSKCPDEELKRDIVQAEEEFKKFGMESTGYRAPYLRSRESLLTILSECNISYSSSTAQILNWRENSLNRSQLDRSNRISLEIYGAREAIEWPNSVRISGGVIDIPTSLPDDEILIDRLGITDERILKEIVIDIIETSLRSNPFAVIQIHPERYFYFREPLLCAIEFLRKQDSVDFVTLSELSDILKSKIANGKESEAKFVSITGDLDIMRLRDLWR